MSERGNADRITRAYLESILIETRYLDAVKPDTSVTLFGERFETPVMTAALSHLGKDDETGMTAYARAAGMTGALHFAGMGPEDELERILEEGVPTVKIIKPYADESLIFDKIRFAVEHGCIAVGMDIDHAFAANGEFDVVEGHRMEPKSTEQLRTYVEAAGIPFIVKGVMSEWDAERAVKAGAAGIVVSHHHGIQPYSLPPLMALPRIRAAVGDEMVIFTDCCIESGYDAFKALALGADAVSVGRAVMQPLKKGGAQGAAERLRSITGELKAVMGRTAAAGLSDIRADLLHIYPQAGLFTE